MSDSILKMHESDNRSQPDLDIELITPAIGAKVKNIDLRLLTNSKAQDIRAALLKHKVLFFSGQDINADEFLTFAELFGTPTLHHPVAPAEANSVSDAGTLAAKAKVWERDNNYRSDHWHTDVTFIDRPVSITMLRCIECPEVGGDTLFANTVAAYNGMPQELRDFADSLRALHSMAPYQRERMMWGSKHDMYSFLTEHPVVRVHSETGERSLLTSPSFVDLFIGYPREVSSALLRIFQSYILKPENVVRWKWSPGDLAMWDNRATQHYACDDYDDAPRQMQRLTVAGGIPVGVDGRESVVLRGDASTFSPIGPS